MTAWEALQKQTEITGDTDVSARARLSTNLAMRKLYQAGDVGSALWKDLWDEDNNEELEDAKVRAAWNKLIPSKNEQGERQQQQEYWYNATTDEYVPLTKPTLTPAEILYSKEELAKQADDESKYLYNIHYSKGNVDKIGVAAQGVDKRHPLAKVRGGMVEQERVKDASYIEGEAKDYFMSQNANAFKKQGLQPRDPKDPNFIDLGLNKGKSEVYKTEKIMQTLPDIAAAIDTANTPEEKAVLQHKFDLMQERVLKNKRQAGQMKYLESKRKELEKIDKEKGGQFSPTGFGDFKTLLEQDPRMFEAYKDLYNREDVTGDLEGKPRSMQRLMIEQFMSEKSNQIQEAIEDLGLSKNESAIMADLLGIYRASDLTPGQATQAIANSVFDPANIAPTAVIGKAAKYGNKMVDAVTTFFKKAPASKKTKQVLAGAAGGAGWTAVEDAARQQLDVHAERKEEIDIADVAKSAGIGAAAGGAIVKALQLTSTGVQKLLKENNLEQAKTKEEIAEVVAETKKDKSLSTDEQLELDKYELEVMQAGEELPPSYKDSKELKGVKERADKVAEEIETLAEEEVAISAKPKVTEREEEPTVAEKERDEESEKITAVDESGKEVEVDLGTTKKGTKTPIADLREEDRLPFAKEFILGKQRVQRVGDETTTEGDMPISSPQQVHKTGRGVSAIAVDKSGRTVEQSVPVKETPEESVDAVMKSYKLYESGKALDPDKRITNKISEMEHRVLAIEGMQAHYKENNIKGDFTKLNAEKEQLIKDIKTRSKDVHDVQVEFDSKSELADEILPSKEKSEAAKAIEEELKKHGFVEDLPALMDVIKKITNYSLGNRLLQRVKKTRIDEVMQEDMIQQTPLMSAIQKILRATEKDGKPLPSGKVKDKIREEVPQIVKNIMGGANDDASKIVALRILDEFDKAAGFRRLQPKVKLEPKAKEKPGTNKKKGAPKDEAREQVIKSWKKHKPKLEEQKAKKAIASEKHESLTADEQGAKSEIYRMLKDPTLSARDRAELMEALTHSDPSKRSETLDPLELTKKKKEQYIERKNNERSQKIFNKRLETVDVTPVNSTRELFDASSQVAQIVGAFFGDLNLFKAIGATKGTKDADYRKVIAKQLSDEGLIPEHINDVKKVVKVATRNLTYVEGRSSAIRGLIDELEIKYDQAERIYDGIIRELNKGEAKGLWDFAQKIANHVKNEEIPSKFELTLPSGRKIKVDAREDVESEFRFAGVELKSKKRIDKAKPGTIAATIVQSLDSYIKDTVIKKMANYDGITVHDGFAFKTDAQKAEATKLYFKALKKINEDNYLNKTLNDISGGRIPLIDNKKIDWSEVVPEELFSPEFGRGKVDQEEIRTNLSLNADRILEPTEILASLLNAADPAGKTGFSGMSNSVIKFLSKSKANQENPATNLSELDEFTSIILRADSIESMQRVSNWWKNKWMKKNNVKPSPQADKAFEQLTNTIRATAESIPEFTKDKLMPRENIMNQYAYIYFKNLAKAHEEGKNIDNPSIEKNIGKDVPIEKIINDAKPEEIPTIMSTVQEKTRTDNAKDIPTKEEEREVVEADGEAIADKIELSEESAKTFDESYKMIHSMNNKQKLSEADISHATHNMLSIIKKTFSRNNIDGAMFKKYILDSGFRHIRGMNKDQAARFAELHKGTMEKYGKYIDAKARAHTNPNERYGYFRNNILMLVMEKENIGQEAAEVRANAILKLSAIKNMTDEHWRYAEADGVRKATKEYLDNIDVWDKASREKGFTSGKENYNDSYLAAVRGKVSHKIDDDMDIETKNHTLGKIVDDEATLKSLDETPNIEGYMETNKIRKVGDKFYRILVDEKAEKEIMSADPLDILSKTIFTAMAKTAGSDQTKNVRELLKNGTIFSNEKTPHTEPLTKEDIQFLADRAGLEVKDITVTHKNKKLGRQIFGRTVYEPFGKKAQEISAGITQAFKYNAVPVNPNSGINGALYTIVKTLGGHPIKGLPALIKATKQIREYKKLDDLVKLFLSKGDMDNYKKAWEQRAKHQVFEAINEGMSINKLDGISTKESLLHSPAKKLFGNNTKARHIARTIFLRPHTPVADQLIGFFSASDSIGRMAQYNLVKGTRHDSGVGAGIKANWGYGNMAHISHPLVETLDTFLLTAFVKWGERTFIELIQLPRAQQLTLMASGLLVNEIATDYDVEDKGFNPARILAEIPDDFIVSPITDTYDKYSGDTSMFEHAVRASSQLVLPAAENKLLMSYLFDQRNGSVNKKMIKLIFPPQGKNWSDVANGTRVRASGKKGSLTDFDGRAWWESMVGRPSKITKEQWDAGEWRNDLNEYIWGKDQLKDWSKLNRKEKLERAKADNPAYSCNFF